MLLKAAIVTSILLTGASACLAEVVLTVNGTVNTDATGLYTRGENVSFSFYLNPDYDPTNSTNAFYQAGKKIYWDTDTTSDSSIWKNVTGSKLTGSWQMANSTPEDPSDYLDANFNSNFMALATGADDPNGTVGLRANGFGVQGIAFNESYQGLDFTDPGFLERPSAYLMNYLGTYAIDESRNAYMQTTGGQVAFDTTSLEIRAVPEPSSMAFFSLGCLPLWVRRRRRLRGKSSHGGLSISRAVRP